MGFFCCHLGRVCHLCGRSRESQYGLDFGVLEYFGAATFARFRRFHPKDSTQLAILWLFQICVVVMGWDGMRIQHDSSHGVKSEAWMTAMMSFPSSVEVLQVRWPFEGLAFMVARF